MKKKILTFVSVFFLMFCLIIPSAIVFTGCKESIYQPMVDLINHDKEFALIKYESLVDEFIKRDIYVYPNHLDCEVDNKECYFEISYNNSFIYIKNGDAESVFTYDFDAELVYYSGSERKEYQGQENMFVYDYTVDTEYSFENIAKSILLYYSGDLFSPIGDWFVKSVKATKVDSNYYTLEVVFGENSYTDYIIELDVQHSADPDYYEDILYIRTGSVYKSFAFTTGFYDEHRSVHLECNTLRLEATSDEKYQFINIDYLAGVNTIYLPENANEFEYMTGKYKFQRTVNGYKIYERMF